MSCKTALQAACISGDEKAVRLLFKATADPLGWEHGTPLQLAAASGRGGAVAELLKAGADANVQNIFKFDSGRRLGKVSYGSYRGNTLLKSYRYTAKPLYRPPVLVEARRQSIC